MIDMTVTSTNGEPVRVRNQPSTSAETIARLKVGTAIKAGDCVNGWRRVAFGDKTGYMMERFLRGDPEGPGIGDRPLTERELSDLRDARFRLEAALKTLRQIVG